RLSGGERLDLEPRRFEQAAQRGTDVLVVVHDVDHDLVVHGSPPLVAAGSAGRLSSKIDPRSVRLRAEIRPPCASTIVRQIASPIPMPFGLRVKKGSKTRCKSARGTPGPVSYTATITDAFTAEARTVTSRTPS